MALDTMAEVMYDGELLLSIGSKEFVIHKPGVNHARINGSLLEVNTIIGPRIRMLEELALTGSVNPYLKALTHGAEVFEAIPTTERRGMGLKDVSTVLDAVVKLAKKDVQ